MSRPASIDPKITKEEIFEGQRACIAAARELPSLSGLLTWAMTWLADEGRMIVRANNEPIMQVQFRTTDQESSDPLFTLKRLKFFGALHNATPEDFKRKG